ncbi:MAG: HAD family phosphatase [Candidatus Gastranaerophilales bacterium]|nr:HAD family phosphatase [Candidatus Gastranaerophilales bacterium]
MKGIIFDFNGTLFWDSQLHYDAWRKYSKILRGTEFSEEEMRKYMFGRTNKDIIQYCIGKEPSDKMVEKYANEKEAMYRQMCLDDPQSFKLADGAIDFLNFLKENHIPMTIATMSEWQNVEFYINEFNLAQWFDLDKIVYSNGKIAGKPAPDIYQIAAKNLNLAPKDCIVIEDALSGIQSAKDAGIGKIIAIASLESHSLYEPLDYLYQIIDNFDEIDKTIFEPVAI